MEKKLGFGCMRLPMKGEEVDYDEFNKMIDYYIEQGFNYFDTAHGYINGKSETAIRDCLSARYPRESFVLTNKNPGIAYANSIATVASVIAQIHSLSGYAQGGIVSGGSYVGDSQIIRVNSGEAVLTQSDQSRFLRLLDGGTVSNNSGNYQAVEFKVRGSDLYGVLKNYSGIQSQAGRSKKL